MVEMDDAADDIWYVPEWHGCWQQYTAVWGKVRGELEREKRTSETVRRQWALLKRDTAPLLDPPEGHFDEVPLDPCMLFIAHHFDEDLEANLTVRCAHGNAI